MGDRSNDDESLRKLFLGGIDKDKTFEDQLKAYFGAYGTVVDCVVIKDSVTKSSKGFGFVTMATIEETDRVLLDKEGDDPHVIDNKKVEVKRAIPRGRDILADPIKKLFITGFKSAPITEDDLREYFGTNCQVEKINIVMDKETGKQKGFAFVELSNRHMVDKAAIIEKHEINGISVIAKKAIPKDNEGGGGGRGGGRSRGRGGYNSGGYGGGDSYGYSEGAEGYGGGYGGDRSYGRGGGRGGRSGRGGGSYGGGGRGGGYSGGSGWGGNGYDSWGGGNSGYDAGSNYAGSSSNYGPMKGGYGGSSGGGGYGGSGYGSGGSYGSGYSGRGGRPY